MNLVKRSHQEPALISPGKTSRHISLQASGKRRSWAAPEMDAWGYGLLRLLARSLEPGGHPALAPSGDEKLEKLHLKSILPVGDGGNVTRSGVQQLESRACAVRYSDPPASVYSSWISWSDCLYLPSPYRRQLKRQAHAVHLLLLFHTQHAVLFTAVIIR